MAFVILRTDIPYVPEGDFNYRRYRSLLSCPPPMMDAGTVVHTCVDPRPENVPTWEERILKSKSRSLATMRIHKMARPAGSKTVLYGRISNSANEASLPAQDALFLRWYEANHERERLPPIETEKRFEDADVSRRVEFRKRPAAFQLLRFVRRGDHVVVTALDRLGCNGLDVTSTIKYLSDRAITIHILDNPMFSRFEPGNPMTELFVMVGAMFSQMEMNSIRRRRKDVVNAAKRSGEWKGPEVPYGFMPLGKTVPTKHSITGKLYDRQLCAPDPVEREVIDECYRCWCAGWSVYELLLVLNAKGVKRLGKPWTPVKMARCLRGIHDERKRAHAV